MMTKASQWRVVTRIAWLALSSPLAGAFPALAQESPEPFLLASEVLVVAPPESSVAGAIGLEEAIAAAATMASGATIRLLPGDYHLGPSAYVDPTCGNCEDPARPVQATLGLRVAGRSIYLQGSSRDEVRIHTHAGYGILFEDCANCRMSGVTVTDGVRDTSGLATDAAVLARRSTLTLSDCRFSENIGDSAVIARTIVGLMGVCGREDAEMTLRNCEILRNSWDGIALYRDARATIEDCVIDGVDRGAAGPACGGRGVGIGLTWNARAEVSGNLVARYWKGIGVFVDADADIRENVVEDCLTWGITLWDADRGTPHGVIEWNAVDGTGACGIAVTRGRPGGVPGSRIAFNAITRTGRNPRYDDGQTYCYQMALAIHATQPDVEIGDNFFFDNREANGRPGELDLKPAEFRAAIAPLLRRLENHAPTRSSGFVLRNRGE